MDDVYTIGIDPDSQAHGVAIYKNRELIELATITTVDLVKRFGERRKPGQLICMENLQNKNFLYHRNAQTTKASTAKVAINVGQCKQAQIELLRWFENYGCDVKLYEPTKDNWTKAKKRFEKATGWEGSSNADTRSAAYFGFLGLKRGVL